MDARLEMRESGGAVPEVSFQLDTNPHDGAAALPDLDNPDEWPVELERDSTDANDPDIWPDAGDPSDALNEADRALNTARILRAAADSIEGKAPPRPKAIVDDWDWREAREEGLICAEAQSMSAVYSNPHGSVVIRQSDPFDDDDPFLVFTPANIPALIRALANEVRLEVQIVSKASSASVVAPPQAPRRRRGEPNLFGDAP